jgi:hypothetical protein
MISRSVGRTALAALALVAVVAGGCTDVPPAAVRGPSGGGGPTPSQGTMGAIDIALAVPPTFQIASVNYQLTNTGYSKSGSLDVSQSQAISGVLGGIPAGTGYTLALTATDTAKKFTGCAGSSPVNVVGGATTPVSVAVDCHLPQASLTPPAVPVPMSAVVLLAVALLAAGVLTTGRLGPRRPSSRD